MRKRLVAGIMAAANWGCSNDLPSARVSTTPLVPDACSTIEVENGTLQSEWVLRSEGDDPSPSQMISTSGAVIADSSLFVVDGYSPAVYELSWAGEIVGSWGQAGGGPGELGRPRAIALGRAKEVYVGDRAGRVTVFTPTGELIRTYSVRNFGDITGIVPLSNGNLVLSSDTWVESPVAYVVIVDSVGNRVKELLNASASTAGSARPLIGSDRNSVRLSAGPADLFAVWYPMDNYVRLFKGEGEQAASIEGCMPMSLLQAYAQQSAGAQAAVPVTGGVMMDEDGGIQIVSMYWRNDHGGIRLRRYSPSGDEVDARDFDTEAGGMYNRYEFLNDTELVAYNDHVRELGVQRLRILGVTQE